MHHIRHTSFQRFLQFVSMDRYMKRHGKIRMSARAACSVSMIFVLSACLACKKEVPVEREPNDSFADATPVMTDSFVQGALSTRDDADVYRLEIHSQSVLDIELSPIRGVNHAFKVWKGHETPVLIKYVDDMRKSSPERLSNLSVDAGVYYISVGFGERDIPVAVPDGIYRLEIRSRPWYDEEREPNDTPAEASELLLDRELMGFFNPAYNRLNQQGENQLREEDWYRIDVELSMERPVLLDIDLSGVERVNSVIELYNSGMERIGLADSGGVHEGESIREIGITASGVYYIMVASKNFEANHEKEYRIKVRSREFDAGMEMEPNDDNARANPITANEISGRIFPTGDQDVFIYHGDGRGLYRVEMTPPDSLDLILEIASSDGTKIFEADNGGSGFKEVLPAVHLKGSFYVTVRSRKSVSDPDKTYALAIRQLTGPEEYEAEPNDRKEQATPLKQQTIKGFTSKRKDRDYFFLDYGKRVKKNFTVRGIPDGELRVSITDPLGYTVRTEEIKGARTIKLTEMIDQKGFIIIDALKENYDEPYILQVMEAK